MTSELARGTAQLGNEAFLSKAPPKVVEGIQRRKGELEMLIEKANAALKELHGMRNNRRARSFDGLFAFRAPVPQSGTIQLRPARSAGWH